MEKFTVLSLISILLYLLNAPALVHSECNACNGRTNTACISSTEYKDCDANNSPFGNSFRCNNGSYCSVLGGCSTNADLKDCNTCGQCNVKTQIACLDSKRFALCLGTSEPSEIVSSCNGELVCDYNNPYICGNSSATCPIGLDTTVAPITTSTTPSPIDNPNGFCQAIQQEGRFPVGTNPDTTCRQYVHCQLIGGTWYGPVYNCAGQTYYDSSKRQCTVALPATCTPVVGGLSFRNIILEE